MTEKNTARQNTKPLTHRELMQKAELLSQPIDFQEFIELGVISQAQAGGWYTLLIPIADLEDHVESKIYEVCRDECGNFMVKFDRRKRSLMLPVA